MRSVELIQKDLAGEIQGQVLTGRFDLARYATDASIYQITPLAVVVPRNQLDVAATLEYAKKRGVAVLPRGGGTSQCGQTVNCAIAIDYSKYMNRLVELDVDNLRCKVEAGIVLDDLNRQLRNHDLWFPVDVSTSSRATIGGMTGNNSCGSRSIRYGLMRDNVISVDALLANGNALHFGDNEPCSGGLNPLFRDLLNLGTRQQDEISKRFPKVLRRVGGYNIDALVPSGNSVNMAHLLVGSEGTLACSQSVDLKLSPLPRSKILGICHFPSFHKAMESAQHIVKLDPVAVELIDRTMIELARSIKMFQTTMDEMVQGEPDAILLVEFAEDDRQQNLRRLGDLTELMSDLGFSFSNPPETRGGVIEAIDAEFQNSVFEVRKAGLNIMMSMRDDAKPISFVEDCAVELTDLAEYTARLNDIFRKYGTRGTWYAHASVGCLHVRPVLDMRKSKDIQAMRAIAEECFDMVLEYKGSHSGEHGDGICRSEFHEKMFGKQLTATFETVKQMFDPEGLMNPGKIVHPLKMDDVSLFRFSPQYAVPQLDTALDWQGWTGAGGGFQGAIEMCNNNGACRKLSGGVMCPSYRATRDEKHVTRGRANILRMAISGQLGKDAMICDEMQQAMELCVSCKACRRECPTGVDMAKMKIEVTAARYEAYGADLCQKLIANLPAYAPYAGKAASIGNLFSKYKAVRAIAEPFTGLSRHRLLPTWAKNPYLDSDTVGPPHGKVVVLFADTFNRWFEPENLRAAKRVLAAAGYRVHTAKPFSGKKPLCCGRTYFTSGMIARAKVEIQRMLDAFEPFLDQQIPIVGLEPSCVLGMRDEIPLLAESSAAKKLAESSYLLEEFLAKENPQLKFNRYERSAIVHGHCHQKSFDQMGDVSVALKRIPGLQFEFIESGCCGMAGAFGYGRDTCEVSQKISELDLLPAIRQSQADTIVVADGISCRHQIELGCGRKPVHAAQLMASAL